MNEPEQGENLEREKERMTTIATSLISAWRNGPAAKRGVEAPAYVHLAHGFLKFTRPEVERTFPAGSIVTDASMIEDALRYRWLRSEEVNTEPRFYAFWQEFNAKLCREKTMDAAIDAAMNERGPQRDGS